MVKVVKPTRVISAFPGTGKSYYVSHAGTDAKVIDLDSNSYTLGYTENGRVRNPDFPNNYIRAIKKYLGTADVIFISCQPETIAALREASIPFILVYPERGLKAEYVERFQRRHSPEPFISLLSDNWDVFLDFLEGQSNCRHIVLDSNQYLGDITIE
jgi:hypothetical protein